MTIPHFIPQHKLISAVSNEPQAVVTTVDAHGYENNQVVRVYVPIEYGMHIEPTQTRITVIDLYSFITTIDTSKLQPYVAPTFVANGYAFTQAQVTPITGVEMNIAPY